jgi:xylulose-5-phosphate/fructose-6-phosphate phosphoketolase
LLGTTWPEHQTRFALELVGDGVSGWYGPMSEVILTLVRDQYAPGLVGHDAAQHRRLAHRPVAGRHRTGAHARVAASVVELACWDLAGHAAGRSVTDLLGGVVRSSVPAYASALAIDVRHPAAAEAARWLVTQGFWGQKWALRKDLICEGPAAVAACLGALREAVPQAKLMIDGLGVGRVGQVLPLLPALEGEITPLIPGVRYTGGQLGPALAVAQGMALDAPHRLVVPLIGDGECETGATAAAWLAPRAIWGGRHGAVLPVVLLNGLKMGGPSLLSTLAPHEVRDYFTGMGYVPYVDDGRCPASARRVLEGALAVTRPLASPGPQAVVVLTIPKGHTGPGHVGERRILGTPAVHKTPLRRPATDPDEFRALRDWLRSYRPHELFDTSGVPTAAVRAALSPAAVSVGSRPAPSAVPGPPALSTPADADADAVLVERAAAGSFRVFSPDELSSNRVLSSLPGAAPPWVTEILNEEICHAWLQGYTETGRDALLPTYDAFATVNASMLVQHLKHRRLLRLRGDTGLPSINYLLTSLGWDNTYTHQNPGLISVLLDLEYGGTRVFTPADAHRAAVVLRRIIVDRDHCNVLVASKHPMPEHPAGPFGEELRHGAATWPHLTADAPPHVVLVSAGDVPARELSLAASDLPAEVPARYVHVNDLTVLGPPTVWPHALTPERFIDLFGSDVPVLLATIGYPAAVRGLLAGRGDADRFHVVGYRDLGRPTSAQELLGQAGLSARALRTQALDLARNRKRRRSG